MKYRSLILFLGVFMGIIPNAQTQKLDSLQASFSNLTTVEDSINNYINIAQFLLSKNPEEGLININAAKKVMERNYVEELSFDLLYVEALLTRNIRKYEQALELFEKYIVYHNKGENLKKLTQGYQAAGALYMRVNQYEKSETYLKIAEKNYREINDDRGLGMSFRAQGSLARRKSNFSEALEFYLQAKDVFEKINDESSLSSTYNSLGILYFSMDDLQNAGEYFVKTYELSMKRGQKLRAANALNNYSGTIKSQSESRIYLLKALALFEELNIASSSAKTHYNIAQSYSVEETDSAFIHYIIASDIYKKNNIEQPQQLKQRIARLYGERGEKQKALSLLKEVESEIDELGEIHFLGSSYAVISETYASIGQYKDAYQYANKGQEVNDSIFSLDKASALAEIETNYEVKEKDLRIENLETKSELNQLKISRRNRIGVILGSSLLILSFLFKQNRDKNKKINTQNEVISKALIEKEALLNEIHHRVKNNLQIISSLLNIQSRSVTDSKAKEALLVGQNRVHSMSLIHQNLYDTENLSGVFLSTYLPTLAQDLCDTYSTTLGDIEIETNVAEIEVDVDTVIPLGLIVNELITNCLKYAFPDNRDGKIIVNLFDNINHLTLSVIDNGIGLSADQLQSSRDSFGHKIINAFKDKLDAEIEITNNNGTQVTLLIRSYKKIRTAPLTKVG